MTGSRLANARMARGLTQKALADRVGVTPKAISNYEKDINEPSPEVLRSLSEALEFPIAYLEMDEVEELPEEAVSFRARSKMPRRKKDAARAHARMGMELSAWMESRFNLPSVDVPDLSTLEPEEAATTLRSLWRLGEMPIENMTNLLEVHGVRMLCADGISADMDAFSLWEPTPTPFVFATTAKSSERRRFDAAHELGHLVLHRHIEQTASESRELESQANAFASGFLMPRASFSRQVPDGLTITQAMRIKKVWGVSLTAVIYRASALGLTSDWQTRALFQRASAMGARSEEPEGMPPERSAVDDQILAYLRSNPDEAQSLEEETGLPTETVYSLLFSPFSRVVEGGASGAKKLASEGFRVI